MHDSNHCDTWREFYWRWAKTTFEHPWSITETIATILALGFPLLAWLDSRWHWFPVIPEPTMNRLMWEVPIVILVVLSLIRIVLTPYWIYRDRHAAAVHRERELEQQLDRMTTAHEKLKSDLQDASTAFTNPVVELIRERQRLERERQPLQEAEECGIKVIPAHKIGKDESDYRKEKIERINRDIAEIDSQLRTRSTKPNEPSASLNLQKEWKELASRFAKLPNYVRADWQCNRKDNKTIYEMWHFAGNTTTQVETLCRYAGTLLMKSPKITQKLSANITKQPDPAWKWLFFLKEQTNSFGHGGIPGQGEDGTLYLLGSICNIGGVSETVCLDCAAAEL